MMLLKDNIELLMRLSEESGIGSDENDVIKIVTNFLSKTPDFDGLGSALYKYINNEEKPLVMLATHCDEVGFQISKINEDGTCSLQQIGNTWNHLVLNQDVYIKTQSGKKIKGLIGCPVTHGMNPLEKQKVVSDSKVYVDLGVKSNNDVTKLGVEVGNSVTFATEAYLMNDPKFVSGKAMDNRVSLYIGSLVSKIISRKKDSNLIFAATVQEEVGLRGARTVAHQIQPDLCIVVDTTAAQTHIDGSDIILGNGVVINVADSMTLLNRGILNYLEDICIKNKINYQLGMFMDGGTDSGNIHKSNTGISTINIGVPIRYMHAHRSIVHLDDIFCTIKVILEIIDDMTIEKLERIQNENYKYKG